MIAVMTAADHQLRGALLIIAIGALLGYLAAGSLGGSRLAQVLGCVVFGAIAWPMLPLVLRGVQ